MTQKHALQ